MAELFLPSVIKIMSSLGQRSGRLFACCKKSGPINWSSFLVMKPTVCTSITWLSLQDPMEIGASYLAQILTLATAIAMSNDILGLTQESHVS